MSTESKPVATTSDELALCQAIRDFADEDTPRLMYADWLEEQGGEYVRCPHNGKCPVHCNGEFYRDESRRVRAELLRVQVEIASVGPMDSERGKLVPLRARESALAARLAEWPGVRPACPACHGGWTYTGPGGGQRSMEKCEHCSGTGRVGSWVRGMASVPVPTLAAVWRRLRSYEQESENPVNEGDWVLTPWARAELLTRPWVCEVPILDREPDEAPAWAPDGSCLDYSRRTFDWNHNPHRTRNAPDELPRHVFAALVELYPENVVYPEPDLPVVEFPTPAAARTALARAVVRAAFSVAGGAGVG